jgi:hypothetical protein
VEDLSDEDIHEIEDDVIDLVDEEIEELGDDLEDDIEELEVIEEVEDAIFEAEGESVFESAAVEQPDFLEPSPVLIEPEYEPEEITVSSAGRPRASFSGKPSPKEATYEIELVQVGSNPDRVIEFLSKVKGLPKSPAELIQRVPTIITRDAKETDAKNFQLLMRKLGAEVRLIQH